PERLAYFHGDRLGEYPAMGAERGGEGLQQSRAVLEQAAAPFLAGFARGDHGGGNLLGGRRPSAPAWAPGRRVLRFERRPLARDPTPVEPVSAHHRPMVSVPAGAPRPCARARPLRSRGSAPSRGKRRGRRYRRAPPPPGT